MPPAGRVIETSLYVDHLDRSAGFYERIFGFPTLVRDDRMCALNVGGHQVLLLFRKGASQEPKSTPGGTIPPNDGDGCLHLAFTMAASDEAEWLSWLSQNGVEIESRVGWERGGASLYFRDPDGHLLELITPGCWEIY